MELQLVNFEQAKALNELGFYCYCDNNRELYVTSNESTWEQEIEIPYSDSYEYITHHETFPVEVIGQLLYDVQNKYSYKNKFQTVYAPTLELAAKWLREEKNIHLNVIFSTRFQKYELNCNELKEGFIRAGEFGDFKLFDSYEEALNAGIDKAIEILKNN